jgi:hypothetical protein
MNEGGDHIGFDERGDHVKGREGDWIDVRSDDTRCEGEGSTEMPIVGDPAVVRVKNGAEVAG